MKKKVLFTIKTLTLVAAVSVLTSAVESPGAKTGGNEPDLSKVVLSVKNMSCSGCISTIKSALSGYSGIGEITVDIAGGTVEIYYDPGKLNDINELEKAITEHGYPAKITTNLGADALRKELALVESKRDRYIASVNGYDIPRSNFSTELKAVRRKVRKAYGDWIFQTVQGRALDNRLRGQVAARLIEEQILLQEIRRSGYDLDEGLMNEELKNFVENSGKTEDEFQQSLKEDGYSLEYFKKKLRARLLINRYLDEKVLASASSRYERERMFKSWFENARILAKVVYYDKGLRDSVRSLNAAASCCASR